MSRLRQNLPLLVIAAVVLLFLGATIRYRGKAPVRLPLSACDAGLWQRVYERDRLQVIEPCTAVEGRVKFAHFNEDGDVHLGFDPDTKSVLNLVNVFHGRGELVVEVVCGHPPRKESAKAACAGYQPQIAIPRPGQRVRVTGVYVTDLDNGWREVHPVSRIEVLP